MKTTELFKIFQVSLPKLNDDIFSPLELGFFIFFGKVYNIGSDSLPALSRLQCFGGERA